MFSGIKNWIKVRFVLLCEIVGYIISLGVLGFALYSMLVSREIVANVQGELLLNTTPVEVSQRSLLAEVEAEDKSVVASGDNLFSVIANPDEIATELALLQLRQAEQELIKGGVENSVALNSIREGIDALPVERNLTQVDATVKGVLRFTRPAESNDNKYQPGEPLAIIFDESTLSWKGSAENRTLKSPIEKGQIARMTLPDANEALQGEVIEFARDDKHTTFSVSFTNALTNAPDYILDYLRERPLEDTPTVSVDIVVGHRSLFRELFGKR